MASRKRGVAELARVARDLAELGRAGCPGAVIGRGYKGAGADVVCLCTTVALGSAYVRFSMYDVRLGSSRALRGFFLMRIDDNTGKQEFFSADELLSNAFAVCLMQGTREATCTEE